MRIASHFALLLCVGYLAGCSATSTASTEGGERYMIPAENLLSNTFAGEFVDQAYQLSETNEELGLVFSGEEVAATIPGFSRQVQGYREMVNSDPAVVVSKLSSATTFEEAIAGNLARIDKDTSRVQYQQTKYTWPSEPTTFWFLTDREGSWKRTDMLPPVCSASESFDGSARHSCSFRIRSGEFELSFSMDRKNVPFADRFAEFVQSKLRGWQVVAAKKH